MAKVTCCWAFFFLFFLGVSSLVPLERQALVDLYHSTQGQYWADNTNWLDGDPCENNWWGVNFFSFGACDENNDHVVEIYLGQNNLTGPLPKSFSALKHLRKMVMNENLISGPLPPYLSLFAELREISIEWNKFSGSIPEAWEWPTLTSLILTGNPLFGSLPEGVGRMVSLETLIIDDTALSGDLPKNFGKLRNLVAVDMSKTLVGGSFPAEIFQTKKIQEIRLISANFSGTLPESLTPSPSLISLYIENNHFEGQIGEWLCNLPDFYAKNNNFTCPYPSSCSPARVDEC